jgi:hypothetical protein
MMTKDLHDGMTPILHRLASALIEAIPEEWSEVTLRTEVNRAGANTRITHSITSEEHPGVPVLGSEELFLATRELQLLCDETGQPWSALVVRLEEVEGQWRFNANFEYPD